MARLLSYKERHTSCNPSVSNVKLVQVHTTWYKVSALTRKAKSTRLHDHRTMEGSVEANVLFGHNITPKLILLLYSYHSWYYSYLRTYVTGLMVISGTVRSPVSSLEVCLLYLPLVKPYAKIWR